MEFDTKLLKKGDESIFNQIVNSYWKRLNKFAQIYTRDNEVAKELVQDTFLSLWNHRKNLENNTKLISFLMIILRNKCLNHLKQIRIETMSIDEIDAETIYKKANRYVLEDDASTLLEAEDLHRIIENTINSLPEKTKNIFQLSRIENLSNKKIAERMNLSVKTVEFHITKSLQHLRIHLPKDYFILFILLYMH
ncbi:MAG: RNA polymerase sigma-70 factor [Tannerella sp.]|jgi:RNA polymerase sigma-70 factor (ECF subfamily)|nr:RNA polymerase sigma-70 factor [Tannerella sp.]